MKTDLTYGSAQDYDKTSLLHHLQRRVQWTLGRKLPLLAYLKVTHRCNLDCYYCPWHTSADDFSEELDTESWKAKIQSMFLAGVRIFVFEGGEPTLRKDLAELLTFSHSLGAKTILATNAVAKPWRFSPTAFTVSVDGPQEVHDRARGQGTYSRILANLLQKGKKRVVSITVLTTENQPYIEELCASIGPHIDGMLFTFLYPYQSRPVTTVIPPGEIPEVKARLLKLKKQYRIINPAGTLKSRRRTWTCHDELAISIDHRGHELRGCFVQHQEPKDCAKCELACFQLLSSFHDFNLEAWFNLHRLLLRAV